jgi:hypothetical protein
MTVRASITKAVLTATCSLMVAVSSPPAEAMVAEAMAVASESTPQSTMSSMTAEPSSRLAKRVWRMPRSWKILVMTGMDVTAAAAAKTSTTADSLSATHAAPAHPLAESPAGFSRDRRGIGPPDATQVREFTPLTCAFTVAGAGSIRRPRAFQAHQIERAYGEQRYVAV